MSSKSLSDYKNNIGNGTWFFLHTIAEAAQTPALMSAYSHNFRNLCSKMSACGCEDHCNQMLNDLPPENYFHLLDEDGIPDGCLRHSVECHNRVNARLGKTVHPYETVKALYRNKEPPAPCTKGKEHPTPSKSTPSVKSSLSSSALQKITPRRRAFEMVPV